MVEIDYSLVPQPEPGKASRWVPPRHVFFGGKNRETGEMIDEPTYTHQEYPCTLYKKDGKKIVAIVVKSDEEVAARGKEWTKNLGSLGVVTCPSFDQITPEMHAATQAEIRRVTEEGRKK